MTLPVLMMLTKNASCGDEYSHFSDAGSDTEKNWNTFSNSASTDTIFEWRLCSVHAVHKTGHRRISPLAVFIIAHVNSNLRKHSVESLSHVRLVGEKYVHTPKYRATANSIQCTPSQFHVRMTFAAHFDST